MNIIMTQNFSCGIREAYWWEGEQKKKMIPRINRIKTKMRNLVSKNGRGIGMSWRWILKICSQACHLDPSYFVTCWMETCYFYLLHSFLLFWKSVFWLLLNPGFFPLIPWSYNFPVKYMSLLMEKEMGICHAVSVSEFSQNSGLG